MIIRQIEEVFSHPEDTDRVISSWTTRDIYEQSVDSARDYILYLRRFSEKKIIYFDGWNGLGAVPVLRSIAQELCSTKAHPPELCFDKIIYLDCSLWESRRMMQRKIAEELKLDHKTMEVFDTEDEEDDFNGVDRSSRDVIQSVVPLIYQALKDSKLMMIFINGSDDEIDVATSGVPLAPFLSNKLLWTFNRRLLTIHDSQSKIQSKLRDTHLFLYDNIRRLSNSEFRALLNEEVTSIVARHPCMQAVGQTMVTDCCLYKLFLHYSFDRTTGFDWVAHASNYWKCAGVIEGDATSSDIVNALQKEIHWKCDGPLVQELFHKFMEDSKTIKFLGLDHCTDNKASTGNYPTYWAYLHSLRVLDLRNTDWDDILSEEKLKIMYNLTELNIEGSRCWQYLSQLKNRLPCLESLRIINPTHQPAAPTDNIDSSFMDKKLLKILDLSGNKDMKYLPTSIANASNLEVLVLDGCDGIENVVLASEFPSSLRSFSFDGYESMAQWKSMVDLPPESSRPKRPSDANKVDVKTLKISLQGFKQLENLFLRGLPNLEELDLSGSTIKVLDFNTMVMDVPNLKRLFLLGCEHLCAIKWVSNRQPELELLCIDTRPGWSTRCPRPSLDKHKPYRLQVYAIIVDERLVRSLCSQIQAESNNSNSVHFNIHITKSDMCGGFVHEEVTGKQMVGPMDQPDLVLLVQYDDVSKEIDDVPSSMEAFPEPPSPQSDCHIEIGGGNRIKSEMEFTPYDNNLAYLMRWHAKSLNMHDSSDISRLSMYDWYCLRWCRVARCLQLDTIFPPKSSDWKNQLETIWASDLPMARCIWSKEPYDSKSFGNLQHLHLRSCPRLQFVLPMWVPSFPNLRTLHVIHCGDLEHVFVLDDGSYAKEQVPIHGVPFPKLTTIHFYDLPKLRQISERRMLAPALETIKIRGCFGLRRLPSLEGHEPGMKRPVVEMEKDVWDALEWDGRAAGHHPDLFEPPVHSRHYRRRQLRGTVLSLLIIYTDYDLLRSVPLTTGQVNALHLQQRQGIVEWPTARRLFAMAAASCVWMLR
ncbi:hypothetical protein EJB05_10648 [Eragrostis curvula]|uniref:Disease resistance protein At4g27190-like leucine-rich repeats domain-containing protein n=1 Tax=Eragrostis curvula TaxID=38414 RepID=A0A5J9VM61_9POAL|nr:hypothetical protein EJB05_10648 [Eragrostis curvula]